MRKIFGLVIAVFLLSTSARAIVDEQDVYAVLEAARQALLAEKFVEAGQVMDKALQMPAFAELDAETQYVGLQLASLAASGREDYLAEHEFLVLVTGFGQADADDWTRRAYAAAQIDAWADTALALKTVTQRWPKQMRGATAPHDLVRASVRGLDGEQHRKDRLELISTLFDARYRFEWDSEPSFFWLDLAEDALARNDLKRARAAAARITESSALIAMRIDKRFDALVAADPKTFDVRAAAEREAKRLKSIAAANPRSLDALVQYGYALLAVGRFEDVLSLANSAIARAEAARGKSPPFDDAGELNWVYNHKASALRALGRYDEAVAVLEAAAKKQEQGAANVSQAINLGMYYVDLGRSNDALHALDGIDWGKGLSPYGRMQLQFVRYAAYLQLQDAGEAEKVLAWFREHTQDSQETAQLAFLEGGDLDAAAALLIARLRDGGQRAAALAEAQTFAEPTRTAREKEIEARRQALYARPDVTAAIAEYGRRETFAIYDLEF